MILFGNSKVCTHINLITQINNQYQRLVFLQNQYFVKHYPIKTMSFKEEKNMKKLFLLLQADVFHNVQFASTRV